MISKEEWLEIVKNYKPPKLETITLAEYRVIQKLARFKCPVNQNPLWCDGHKCPCKPNSTEDYYQDCKVSLVFRIKLMKVGRGEIKVE